MNFLRTREMDRVNIIKKNRNEWFDKAVKYKAENDKLKEFARKVISWECWEGGDLDGGTVQDLAEKLGLITPCIATTEDVGDPDFAYFDVGDTIYRFTDILKGDKP